MLHVEFWVELREWENGGRMPHDQLGVVPQLAAGGGMKVTDTTKRRAAKELVMAMEW